MSVKELPPEAQIKHDALSQAIRSATLGGRFSGHYGALELEDQRLKLVRRCHKKGEGDLVAALSAASSTYYAAGGNAWAKRQFGRAAWRLAWARLYSNEMVRLAGGLDLLSADQLEIRASICRQWRDYRQAEECVVLALARNGLPDNTRALLLLQQAKIHERNGREKDADMSFLQAINIARIGNLSNLTKSRIMRAYGSWLESNGYDAAALVARKAAEDYAKETGLEDQLVKIQAERRI